MKVDGKRAYAAARAGQTVEVKPRTITVYEYELLEFRPAADAESGAWGRARIRCSKGTYIRSLAFDFGQALQSGAHLTALRRTKIGDYDVQNAVTPATFEEHLG